jgi:hypothetical protein
MGVDVVDVHEHAVDDPRDRQPSTRRFAVVAVVSWTLVLGSVASMMMPEPVSISPWDNRPLSRGP